jgi:hypothetical protein
LFRPYPKSAYFEKKLGVAPGEKVLGKNGSTELIAVTRATWGQLARRLPGACPAFSQSVPAADLKSVEFGQLIRHFDV